MMSENPAARGARLMPVFWGLALFMFLIFVVLPGAKSEQDAAACVNMTAEEIYARLKKETLSHNTYTATYFHFTARGKNHEIYAQGVLKGRYRQNPLQLCETRLELKSSFPEQAGVGNQECYSGKDEIDRLLMPGAYRVLGVITMFAEDPKSSYLNGENMNNTAVWTWFGKWDRMLDGGKISAKCEEYKGKQLWVLSIVRGKNQDPLYNHSEVHIFVDPEKWFPIRTETFVPNDSKPVQIYEFRELQLDVPLTDKDFAFEGLAPGWNLVGTPGGPKLETLAQVEPTLQDSPGLEQNAFLALLDQALAGVKDYSTEMTLELRYRRLRQYRQDHYQFIRQDNAFSSLCALLQTDYMLLNSGKGFRTVFDPARDKLIHVLPAGVYKFMGEQTFPLDDPRLFSAIGDNITELDFFTIRNKLKTRLQEAIKTKTAAAAYGDLKGPYIEVEIKDLGIPARPAVFRLMLDDKTHLPARLEYRGYDDPKGFLTIAFANTRVNINLKNDNLWK